MHDFLLRQFWNLGQFTSSWFLSENCLAVLVVYQGFVLLKENVVCVINCLCCGVHFSLTMEALLPLFFWLLWRHVILLHRRLHNIGVGPWLVVLLEHRTWRVCRTSCCIQETLSLLLALLYFLYVVARYVLCLLLLNLRREIQDEFTRGLHHGQVEGSVWELNLVREKILDHG